MGRNKLDLKKIQNATSRQVTYSKRRNGLLKKAYELSVLCDIDVALITFSPSGRLSHFSGNKRIEDVFSRLINLPARLRDFPIENKEYIETILDVLRRDSDMSSTSRNNIEKLEVEIQKTKEHLEVTEAKLRDFEPDVGRTLTMREVESSEKKLYATLSRVQDRKNQLLFGPPPEAEFTYELKGGQPLMFDRSLINLNAEPFPIRPHWRSFVSLPNEIPINGAYPFGNGMPNGYVVNQAPLQYVDMQPDYQAPFPPYPTMQGMEGYQMHGMLPHEQVQQVQISPEFMDLMGNNAPQQHPYQQEGEDAAHFYPEAAFPQGNMDHQNLQMQPYAGADNPIEGFQEMHREDLHLMEMDNQVNPIDNNAEDFDEGMWPYELHPRRLPNWVDALPPTHDENWLQHVHSPSNSQMMGIETSSRFSGTSPSIYDPAYQGMGLDVDPHLRVYNSSQSDSGSSGLPPWDLVATSSAVPTELVPPGFETFKKDRVAQWVSTDMYEEETSDSCSNMPAL